MQNKTYSPKEIAAFRGLLQLAAGGKHFSNIKVQDIATAASIGKGTLYEYFSSKEDILSCTMLYTLQQFADWIEQQMTREQSVYDMLDSLIDALGAEIFCRFPLCRWLVHFCRMSSRWSWECAIRKRHRKPSSGCMTTNGKFLQEDDKMERLIRL